ncbi:hypothetical protein E0H26_21735 [Micromonospora zingiberis]|uniref:Uncharacterized protein n=2 Tax=Micromonospora zingiberis TaxID=2053011 RepID=A0A4R0GFZ3_9ACTN|nr:hypothetical protein E0H26_21735 [Micromonospora zingiberis]
MVRKWEAAAPVGGTPGSGRLKNGQQVRPSAVERAEVLREMLADFPQLAGLLEESGLVREVMKDARSAQERMDRLRSSRRRRNPYARAARLRSTRFEKIARRDPSALQGSPYLPGLRHPAPTARRR